MATLVSQLVPIQTTPGVQPDTDQTPLSTPHYTLSDKIRFWRGIPQKIGGWISMAFEYGEVISGIARSLFSAAINSSIASIIGTNSDLYSLYGQQLTNISPLLLATISISSSLTTDYGTLAANPITTLINSGVLTIADTNASKYQVNDRYTLSGSTTVNGILNVAINAQQVIRSIGTNQISITVSGSANASGAGGGGSVIRSTGLITVSATANNQSDDDRVKISGAVDTGGILAANINKEFIIRNAATDSFGIMTAGTATSLVTGGGGTATVYQKQIPVGNINQSFGSGYGLGKYGVGLYGVAKVAEAGIFFPRIWFFDRFGDKIIATPGNQGGIYLWDGSTTIAPALLENAPTDVNYAFVSDNILVTFGHENLGNQIFSSDQGDATQWSASSLNQVFQDVIEGADRFLSHVPVLGINLIFTQSQTYQFSYIGLPDIWSIKLLDNSVGIIGPMARCSVNNVAYWMAHNNFFMWSGGNVQQIPANTQDQCTMLKYVFGNINNAQSAKCFGWYNDIFNEVWFHYPSQNSNECDRIARVSISDNVWSPDTMDRTCAEYPDNLFLNPRLISSSGIFYNHELGNDADGIPLPFSLTSNLRTTTSTLIPVGKDTTILTGFVPDSIQVGDINVNLSGYLWPQTSATTFNTDYTISDSAPRENIQIGGRFWKYTWSGSSLGQQWIMGSWSELQQKSAQN